MRQTRISAFLSRWRHHRLGIFVAGAWAVLTSTPVQWYLDKVFGEEAFRWVQKGIHDLRRMAPWVVDHWVAVNVTAFLVFVAALLGKMYRESRPPSRGTSANEDPLTVFALNWTLADSVASRDRDRHMPRFTVVHRDGSSTRYSAPEVDAMSPVQRQNLFALDPHMKEWWHGKPSNGPQTMFRLPGGYWIHKELLRRSSEEARRALWDESPDALDWHVSGEKF